MLTMLKIIQRQLMSRFNTKREALETIEVDICSWIEMKLVRSKRLGSHFICRGGNGVEFEVNQTTEERRVVNICNWS